MDVQATLSQLEAGGLLRQLQETDPAYIFKHALTQETAYQSLLGKRRRSIHRLVAAAYEQTYGQRLDEYAALLGQHYAEAGDDGRALEYEVRAADAAARLYANAEAVMHYTRAIDLAGRGTVDETAALWAHLYLSRGNALELSAQYDAALANYYEMEALAHRRGDRALELAALMAQAPVRSTPTPVFDAAQAQALCDRALVLAREMGDHAAEAKVLWILLLLNFFNGDMDLAVRYGEQALALARQFGLREQLAFTLNDIGRAYGTTGHSEQAIAALEEAHDLWQSLNNIPMLADNLTSRAEALFFSGDYPRALDLAGEALRLSRSIGNLWGESYSLEVQGFTYLERGEIGKGIAALEEAVRLGLESGMQDALISGRTFLAMAYAYVGDVARGLDIIYAALAVTTTHLPAWQAMPRAMLAYLYSASGDVDRARTLSEDIGRDTDVPRADWRGEEMLTWLVACELALAEGDYRRVIAVADYQIEGQTRSGIHPFLADSFYFKGKALLAEGKIDEAAAALDAGRAKAEAVGSDRSLWPILAALADVEARRGNAAQAQAWHTRAREIVETIADGVPWPEMRASFLSRPDVRIVLEDASER